MAAVINASLYGTLREASRFPEIGAIYGAVGGVNGIFQERFVDFKSQSSVQIDLLPYTPASAIGTSRTKISPEDYVKAVGILKKNRIKYLLIGKILLNVLDKMPRHNVPPVNADTLYRGLHFQEFHNAARNILVRIA
jgi:hypothetical protein